MSKQKKQSRLMPVLLWLVLALPELLLHIAASKNTGTLFNSGLLLGPLFALLPATVVFLVYSFIPNRWGRYALVMGYSLVCFLLCASQAVYYKVFGTFYTFYSMTHGTDAFQFVNTIVEAILGNWVVLVLMAVPVLLTAILSWKPCRSGFSGGWGIRILLVVLAAAVQFTLVRCLPALGGTGDTDPYGLYHNSADSYLSVNKLGLFTAFRLDLQRTVSGDSAEGSITIQTQPTETMAPVEETTVPETTLPLPTIDTSPNVLSIDFEALIAGERNESVAQVHQYFASRTPSRKNEMTGIFAGCNLIQITAEAFSDLIITPERTPTLYKLMSEGISFSNYYVPDWGVSTTDGEYAFLTGTIPKNGVWSFKKSSDNAMPLTMSRQLIGLGYNAFAYHGHSYTYYGRDQYLPNLGYTYKGLGNGLDVVKQWPESDVEVVEASFADYVNAAPFATYYMSISGHREFNFYGNMMAHKNKALVADEPYSEPVRAYISCQLELEHALALLLQKLEEAGQLDNTVIVLTADHYPNGLTPEEIGELRGSTPEGNFEIFENGAFIWKSGMEPIVVDTPCSHLDLLPTLSNLFGLEFDSRLYMGRDVFSDTAPLVMFRNRSWITDQAMYNADTGKVTSLTGSEISEDYIRTIKNEVSNRFSVSTRILDYDYWRILFE